MKKIFLFLTAVIFTFTFFTGCEDNKDAGVSEGLSVKVYSPTKVVAGQEVVISGTGLSDVNEVIFPGNKSVTAIKVISNNMISVITPAGITAGGELTVKSPGGTVTARIPMTVAAPSLTAISPSGKIGSGDELVIAGVDLEYFDKVIFPGEVENVTVKAIDFLRKSTSFLRLIVPEGIKDGPGRIKLETAGGVDLLLPEIILRAGPSGEWQWKEIAVVWSGSQLIEWGNGLTFQGAWFNDAGLKKDDLVRCYVNLAGGQSQIKFYTGSWGAISLREDFANVDGVPHNGAKRNDGHFDYDEENDIFHLDFPMTDDLFTKFTASANILATGDGVTFKKISIHRQVWVEYD
jgi:IPT/TIG domain.